ncbi:hypothetical protein [Corynebacterium terpenotabidum]|uniref:hypothetical protein n=1 Tax=Corynebacterium terpenotabidum TaxID=89154 RepID=UPI0012EE8E63|nr:hypothetical protein [Corynebacterium terpenotabidum]
MSVAAGPSGPWKRRGRSAGRHLAPTIVVHALSAERVSDRTLFAQQPGTGRDPGRDPGQDPGWWREQWILGART